jgi:sialate O-acetylesterase
MPVPETHMRLKLGDDERFAVELSGTWRCMPERELPRIAVHSQRPASLYNGMLYPIRKYSIRGFAWYQGESDASAYERHNVLFPALIHLWRKLWGMGDLPFFFVQLPNYGGEGAGGTWAYMRESQAAALALPNTGMAVIIDCGESHNIHPDNKWEPGIRLALQIEKKVYGLDIEESGPVMTETDIRGNTAAVRFSHAEGMHARGELAGFELAGEDRKFYPAQAVLDGDSVTLTCDKVPNPAAIRYAWADDPPSTLYNGAGLPAAPFRTDNWPLSNSK